MSGHSFASAGARLQSEDCVAEVDGHQRAFRPSRVASGGRPRRARHRRGRGRISSRCERQFGWTVISSRPCLHPISRIFSKESPPCTPVYARRETDGCLSRGKDRPGKFTISSKCRPFSRRYDFETVYLEGMSMRIRSCCSKAPSSSSVRMAPGWPIFSFANREPRSSSLCPRVEMRPFFWLISEKLDLVHGCNSVRRSEAKDFRPPLSSISASCRRSSAWSRRISSALRTIKHLRPVPSRARARYPGGLSCPLLGRRRTRRGASTKYLGRF